MDPPNPMALPDTTKVFGDIAEQMPMFPGGDRKLMGDIWRAAYSTPPECKSCVQGRVIVTFVVERDGSISNAKVIKHLDPLLDAEGAHAWSHAMPRNGFWPTSRRDGGRKICHSRNLPPEMKVPLIGICRHRLTTDGAGVTTLVAFHGCSLNCRYCLNRQPVPAPRWRAGSDCRWRRSCSR